MLHPISFSIPKEKLIDIIPSKTKLLSSLIPGKLSSYIYNNQDDYYKEYQSSLFAITTKKGGWDCMRHYEIMANGCIPYFPNIEQCSINTMALLPKDLFQKGNNLYKRHEGKGLNDLTNDDINECNLLIREYLNFVKDYLTTKRMAEYILDKSFATNSQKILYLSGNTCPDYLRCVTLHGFKELLGSNCHDYPKVPHIYKSPLITYINLYGRGITYSNLLDQSLHNDSYDTTIEKDIENKAYDLIIYGSYHRGMPYYDMISKIYNPEKIILLCGEDIHKCNYNEWINRGHHVFIRERD